MARKDAMAEMREVLLTRREALRKALNGDLSMLQDLREQSSGDVVDFALDSAQDGSVRNWQKLRAASYRASTKLSIECVKERTAVAKLARARFLSCDFKHYPTQYCASIVNVKRKSKVSIRIT